MAHSICVHTDDKKYCELEAEPIEFSSQSFDKSLTHGTVQNPDALNNQVWDNSEIVYWTNDSDYDFISIKNQEKLIKLALLESSVQTPLVIRQRKRKTADAQIRIKWLKMKDEKYFKSKSTLAFAGGPGKGLGGDCTMNADVLWIHRKKNAPPLTVKRAFELGFISDYNRDFPNSTVKSYDPLHTLKHEVGGHSLGMRHIENANERLSSIMYPFYNGLRIFGMADLAYLHRLYGKASVHHKIKKMLLSRIRKGIPG